MIVSPSRLPEPAPKPGILNVLNVLNALNARIVSCEVFATATHCIELAISHERSRSIHAAG